MFWLLNIEMVILSNHNMFWSRYGKINFWVRTPVLQVDFGKFSHSRPFFQSLQTVQALVKCLIISSGSSLLAEVVVKGFPPPLFFFKYSLQPVSNHEPLSARPPVKHHSKMSLDTAHHQSSTFKIQILKLAECLQNFNNSMCSKMNWKSASKSWNNFFHDSISYYLDKPMQSDKPLLQASR